MKKIVSVLLIIAMISAMFCSCSSYTVNKNLDTKEKVTLTICGPWSDCKAIEAVSSKFSEKYPNCTVQYEYVQDYEDSIVKRLKDKPETVDLFLTSSIQSDSPKLPYAMELFSQEGLDLSDTNDALIKNFTLLGTVGTPDAKIYTIPLGGEVRGMFVNKTLLASLGLKVPTNSEELLSACKKLKEAGYVPLQGNPGSFAQQLLYPYVCNMIANSDNYEETYKKVNGNAEGISEMFKEPMSFMYTLMSNYYYNYKYVEKELNMFTDMSNEGSARYFFNLTEDGDDYKKVDDKGTIAFMPGILTQKSVMENFKEDYHSNIDYEFILSPVSSEGGYAYVSPTHGISANKNSAHADWTVEFLNFLFSKDINKIFAEEFNCIPNTTDSFKVIKDMFDVSDNKISDLGQCTFDYPFYGVITDSLIEVSKGNNPKYMNKESGKDTLYSLDYYMNNLEERFAAER